MSPACLNYVAEVPKEIKLPNSRLTILPSLLIGKSERPYIRVVVWLVVCHGRNSSDVTLAFEDAQVIQTVIDDE
jgi:hypothetical protein